MNSCGPMLCSTLFISYHQCPHTLLPDTWSLLSKCVLNKTTEWKLWKQNYIMCLMGHQILISCTKCVFLVKWISPLSLLILSFEQMACSPISFVFSSFKLLLSSPFLPLLDCKAFPWEEAHPSCQSQSGTLFRIVGGFVSKVNEVAGTTNICQRVSNLFQLLETGRHSSESPSPYPGSVCLCSHRGTHTERDRLFTLSGEHTRWEKFTPWFQRITHTPPHFGPWFLRQPSQHKRRVQGWKLDQMI